MVDKADSQRYIYVGGEYCPYCEGTKLDNKGEMGYVSAGILHHSMGCNTCGMEWTDVFTLTGVKGKMEEL